MLVSAGILLTRLIGLGPPANLLTLFRTAPTSPTRSTARSAFRIFCRISSARACSRPLSFPVYSRLLAEGDEEEAGRVAGAVAAILALTTAVLVLLGVLAAPFVIDVLAGGFQGEKRELTIRWFAFCFRARDCWCSRRGAWAC